MLDASGIGQMLGTDASVPVAAQYPDAPDHRGLPRVTAFPMARSMTPIEGGSNGHNAQPLVNTSPQSWAEADLASLSAERPGGIQCRQGRQAGTDHARRGGVGAGHRHAAEARQCQPRLTETPSTPETRVVAIGDSDFAANYGDRHIGQP